MYKEDVLAKIEIKLGDITALGTEAIVNAANPSLLGGGGVDGAIHKAAGIRLLDECKTLKGCEVGEAKITEAYNINSKKIIHTPGPVWRGGSFNEENLLANSYLNSLKLSKKYNFKSIAFPAISTGIYGFSLEKATRIALNVVLKFIDENIYYIDRVVFVCFSENDEECYKNLLKEIKK